MNALRATPTRGFGTRFTQVCSRTSMQRQLSKEAFESVRTEKSPQLRHGTLRRSDWHGINPRSRKNQGRDAKVLLAGPARSHAYLCAGEVARQICSPPS